MSGKAKLITTALNSSLTACLISLTAPTIVNRIAWGNEYFDPNATGDSQAGTRWFMPTVIPGEPYQLTVGGVNYGYNHHIGIYQIDCYYPKGAGLDTVLEMADSIASHFKRGGSVRTVAAGALIITEDGQYIITQSGDPLAITADVRVRFERSWVNQALVEDRWIHVPVTVRWFADIDNT